MDEASTNSLFKHLGIRREVHPRVLAAMPQETLTAYISFWRLEKNALLSPAEMSQGVLGHAARIMCGVVKRQSEIDAVAARTDALRQQRLKL